MKLTSLRQVIFIGDPNMVENLRNHQRYHEHTQQRALIGGSLPHVPDCRDLGPDGCNEDQPPDSLPKVPEADAAYEEGDFIKAAALFGQALAFGCVGCTSDSERAWFAASIHRYDLRIIILALVSSEVL